MPPQRLSSLFAGLAQISPEGNPLVGGIELDSRRLRAGDLFLACRSHGGGRHGLAHLPQALRAGAVAVAWEPDAGIEAPQAAVPCIRVDDLTRHAGRLASRFFGEPSAQLFMVGITGTDGKTSTAHILAQALQHLGSRCGYLGTLGCGFLAQLDAATHTTPDAVTLQRWLAWLKHEGADSVMMEVSSHALDQQRVRGVDFDLAVLTNISRDHLDYHGDLEHYVAAKRRLLELPGLRAAILNQDDAHGRDWLQTLPGGVEGVAYGIGRQPAGGARFVLGSEPALHDGGLSLAVATSWGSGRLESRLLGRFNAYNLLAALAVLLERGTPLADALDALHHAKTVPGRMEAIRAGAGFPLVAVDYAHTPEALAQALDAMRAHTRGKLCCVFGCGGDRDRGKRPLMAAAAALHADELVITDDNPRGENPQAIVADMLPGLPAGTRFLVEHDRAAAIAHAIRHARAGDGVLVAGKGHEDYQVIGDERRHYSDRETVARILSEDTCS
jgi:UDP-N-acetylmuramoyl-L-alanyl-D-glutamate--2,6-diaminopimelate ligase